ncbi:MAG: DNA-directed RNA polymerase subunit K [Thermofilum sp.]
MTAEQSAHEEKIKIEIGPPWLTRYEKARIIGIRALQIALGAPVLVKAERGSSPVEIAEKELREGALPIIIVRWTPSGRYQEIPLKYLRMQP